MSDPSIKFFKAEQITANVMRVNENTFAIPSQTRPGKAHIITSETIEVMVSVPNEVLIGAGRYFNQIRAFRENIQEGIEYLRVIGGYATSERPKTRLSCTCEDHQYRPEESCKHMLAVEMRIQEGDI